MINQVRPSMHSPVAGVSIRVKAMAIVMVMVISLFVSLSLHLSPVSPVFLLPFRFLHFCSRLRRPLCCVPLCFRSRCAWMMFSSSPRGSCMSTGSLLLSPIHSHSIMSVISSVSSSSSSILFPPFPFCLPVCASRSLL